MAYGVITRMAAPIEAYDALHAGVLARHPDVSFPSLLVHIGCPDGDGFQVIEVWESKEEFERYTREVVAPAVADADDLPSGALPQVEEFEVRGLVVPRGPIAF